jgi:hypothetical protein
MPIAKFRTVAEVAEPALKTTFPLTATTSFPEPSPRPLASPSPAPPPPAPASPVPPPPRPASAAPTRVPDSAAIDSVLHSYRAAFRNLDAASIEAFWPTANTKTLKRAFDQLDAQEFTFGQCETDIAGNTAIATCHGVATTVPKVGDRTPRIESRRWTFNLEKLNESWFIRRVASGR